MSILQAILLGILQGLTEFLPISSSGHLILVRDVLGWGFGTPQIEKTFDVALHFGTFIGITAYFLSDIGRLFRGFARAVYSRNLADPYSRLSLLILIATIPAALAGFYGEEFIENRLGAPLLVCGMLIFFGLLMAWADWAGRRQRDLSSAGWWDGIIIGIAQALALMPGTSRSGVTITAGLFLGLRRETAARFSFLISLPAVAGAALLKGVKLFSSDIPQGLSVPMAVGTLAAALSGLFAISWLLRYLQTHSLKPFVIYRIVL
ncbi:MAG: undecaprenyl-diphosphatase UppP, partial [Armatimonadetes bacterium]|nr:undecaprenyl-diphosphatase UppP [Armatimonadota bacterium]NIM23010.1 undecaprenyl-diphosphatase UppP [Armatimonadota bacterium]NIM66881.1 undecaprenyl-diphosphatase UppP [Armatimonadota bacterium]NIM75421.1 undecaprenyl-diphosphatase UppP [Armatimonadota bacterium]NIN05068.1 undecaprenyl-diphosphatase UppP [Armatimonadota bacterium]